MRGGSCCPSYQAAGSISFPTVPDTRPARVGEPTPIAAMVSGSTEPSAVGELSALKNEDAALAATAEIESGLWPGNANGNGEPAPAPIHGGREGIETAAVRSAN
jgi:hypothetical protein